MIILFHIFSIYEAKNNIFFPFVLHLFLRGSLAGLPEQMDDKLHSADIRCFDGDWVPSGI